MCRMAPRLAGAATWRHFATCSGQVGMHSVFWYVSGFEFFRFDGASCFTHHLVPRKKHPGQKLSNQGRITRLTRNGLDCSLVLPSITEAVRGDRNANDIQSKHEAGCTDRSHCRVGCPNWTLGDYGNMPPLSYIISATTLALVLLRSVLRFAWLSGISCEYPYK